jgi:hypothetical protein
MKIQAQMKGQTKERRRRNPRRGARRNLQLARKTKAPRRHPPARE